MKTTHLRTSLFFALAVHATASHGATPKIDEAAVAEMRKGQTTYEEIVRRYGRPNVSSTNWDGERTAAYAYGGGWSPAALSALGAALGSTGGDTVVLYFDGKGLLKDHKINQAAAKSGEVPAAPARRYVEPSYGWTRPAPAPKPATTSSTASVEATPPATPSTAKPAEAQAIKSRPRNDGLPGWLPSTSTREDRY